MGQPLTSARGSSGALPHDAQSAVKAATLAHAEEAREKVPTDEVRSFFSSFVADE